MKEELFDDVILERGYEYAQEGAVDHVRKVGEVIYATVHGTEDYHVKIDDNDMFCDMLKRERIVNIWLLFCII